MSDSLTGQVVLEAVLLSAMENAIAAKARGDFAMVTALYTVLSTAYSQADVFDLEFMDGELRKFDPDSLLK